MEESGGAYGRLAETLLSMGVEPGRVALVLLDRARPSLAEAMGKAFPEAEVIISPGAFAEGIIGVTQDDSLRKPVERLINRVFAAQDYSQAEERLMEFKGFLQHFEMDVNIWFYDMFHGDDIISVYKLRDQGVWDGYSLSDLMPHNNWIKNIAKMTNSPGGVEETVKGLFKFLSRKKRKSPKN